MHSILEDQVGESTMQRNWVGFFFVLLMFLLEGLRFGEERWKVAVFPPCQSSAEGFDVVLGPRITVRLLKQEVVHDCKCFESDRLHRACIGEGIDEDGFLSAEFLSELA